MCILYTLIKLSRFDKVMCTLSFSRPPLVRKITGFRVIISSPLTALLFSLEKELD